MQDGQVVKSFDAAATTPATGGKFALPARASQLTWQTSFGSAPVSITILIETSLDNSNWATVAITTAVAGETGTLNTSAIFIRSKITSSSGGSGVTVQLVAKAIANVRAGVPGGVDTDVQFNDAGVLGGSAGFLYDKTNQVVAIGGVALDSGSGIRVDKSTVSVGNAGIYVTSAVTPTADGTLGTQGIAIISSLNGSKNAGYNQGLFIEVDQNNTGTATVVGGTETLVTFNGGVANAGYGHKVDSPQKTGSAPTEYVGLDMDDQTLVGTTDNWSIAINDKYFVAPDGTSFGSEEIAFSALPSTPFVGQEVNISDANTATWGASITTTGANHVKARWNGTAWTVVGK